MSHANLVMQVLNEAPTNQLESRGWPAGERSTHIQALQHLEKDELCNRPVEAAAAILHVDIRPEVATQQTAVKQASRVSQARSALQEAALTHSSMKI